MGSWQPPLPRYEGPWQAGPVKPNLGEEQPPQNKQPRQTAPHGIESHWQQIVDQERTQ